MCVCDWKADAGGHVHSGTLEWWRHQQPNDVVFSNTIERVPLAKALRMFTTFCEDNLTMYTIAWQRGNMDQIWLSNAYERSAMDSPLDFRCWQDQRTLCRELKGEVPFQGNKHDALDDAKHQARCILEALKTVNSKGK